MAGWSKHVRNRWGDALSRVGWRDFERLLADYYRRQGYRVEHCGTGASAARFDGGIDLKLFRDDEYLVVQCKHWNIRQVPHNAMHELAGIMLTEGATGAILVTSGEFTPHARASAAKLGNMRLIDGNALRAMLGHVPEPAPVVQAVEDRAARIMEAVGDRMFQAAEHRVRRGIRHGARTAATNFIWLPLAKFALFLLLITFVVTVLTTALNRVNTMLGPRPQAVSQTVGQPQPAVSPLTEAMPPAPQPRRVDATVIHAPAPPPLTEAEIREQQRLADEAMRILAPNTPEMDMGYPDDTHSDRYRAPERAPDVSAGWAR